MENYTNYKYYAFISYSHEDEEVAKRIQKKLTEYKLPSVIRKANPLLPENVRPIFRDVTNLTTGMLQGKLNTELEHSKFLIVLCSPNSAKPNDDCYIAGLALYDNNFFDQKWVPRIWKNGKWTRLENPYGNYYGRISRALVMK